MATALESLGSSYFEELAQGYRRRRDLLHRGLVGAGFSCTPPEGAYYILADFSALSAERDTAFAEWLTAEIGVAPVPGSSFMSDPERGRRLIRFAFCKTEGVLAESGRAARGGKRRGPLIRPAAAGLGASFPILEGSKDWNL